MFSVSRFLALGLSAGLVWVSAGTAWGQQGDTPPTPPPAVPDTPSPSGAGPGMPQPQPGMPGMQQPGLHLSGDTGSGDDPAAANKAPLSRSDQDFLRNVAMGNQFEILTGHLAVEKGATQQVKDFGQRMIDDHTRVNEQLQSLATRRGLTLPTELSSVEQSEYNKLAKLSGADFDKAYWKTLAKDHDADVKAVKKETTKAQDPEVKAFAQQILPAFEAHDKMVHSEMKSRAM